MMTNNNSIKLIQPGYRFSAIGILLMLTACTTTTPPDQTMPTIVAPAKATAVAPTVPPPKTTLVTNSAPAAKKPKPAVITHSTAYSVNPTLWSSTPSTDLWERLRAGFQIIPQTHPLITAAMQDYQDNPEYFARLQQQAEPYLHYILTQVEQRQMPTEIALLPAIESSFRPEAVSPRAAAGLWQFVPGTGRDFGLEQTAWYDERQDIEASTTAALDYLQALYDQFGSWSLALAAYNCGPGKVERMLQTSGQEYPTYWSLLDNLPGETQHYVPKLLALATIIAEPEQYQISLAPFNESPELAKVEIERPLDLSLIAQMANLSLEKLKQLNPGYKRNNTGHEKRCLLVPKHQAKPLEQQLASLPPKTTPWYQPSMDLDIDDSLALITRPYNATLSTLQKVAKTPVKGKGKNQRVHMGKQLIILTQPTLAANTKKSAKLSSPNRKPRQTYTVKRGDTLWTIAAKHGLSTQQIAQLNAIKPTTKVRPGQKLVVQSKT